LKENNILVVEDDLHMRIFITTVLETSGYNATATKDGKEGIQKAREAPPDLKADDKLKDIPVVMLSGVESRTFSHSLKMMNIGLEDPLPDPEAYMEKPPKAEELLKIIERIFEVAH
jgi:CheY-like chemotaxis protein